MAVAMLDDSVAFVKKLFGWMMDQYHGYGIGSGIADVDKWELVCLLIRIIFRNLRQVRQQAQHIKLKDAKTPRHAVQFVWAAIQAHQVAAQYLDKDFSLHPSISPVLTSHLLDVCAFKEEVTKLEKGLLGKVEAVRNLAKDAVALAKAAQTAADKAAAKGKGKNKRAQEADDEEQ